VNAYKKSCLPGGLRVITEEIPTVRSASIGVWVGTGSCWETTANMGISHFIEHMLFKGTAHRSARELARAIDVLGGTLNAYTSKDHTCFYVKVLDQHLPIAVDVLADMLQHSLFDPADIEKEKTVVIEEIKMYEDVPDDLVHDLFAAAIWPGHPLGQPIVGTAESVQSFTRDDVLAYFGQHYRPGNVVIAAAGNIRHQEVVDLVGDAFSELCSSGGAGQPEPPPPAECQRPAALLREKETEQAHLVVGMKGLEYDHDETYALHLLSTILGGGASSRLFQEIREERGLAYSVYSFQSHYRQTGAFAVYAGASPDAMEQVLDLILAAFETVGRQGVDPRELAEAKEQLKGQIMLGLESTSGRMSRLGRGELCMGRVLTPDEIISRIDAVTPEQVHDLARRLFHEEPLVLSAVGPRLDALNLPRFGFQEVQHG